ncbi:MAG: nitrate/nitrite transporter NrtS [Chloroflexota bacterium]|nr:nitrate/nitrite transporter NrtS [Chloroflexota bacterium]
MFWHAVSRYVRDNQCILTSSSLVKRSAKASVIVGTLLLALNQGDFIIAGDFYTAMLWKIPLTYLVPFCVSSWGSITNAKRFSRS